MTTAGSSSIRTGTTENRAEQSLYEYRGEQIFPQKLGSTSKPSTPPPPRHRKGHTSSILEDPQILGVTCRISVTRATWRPAFVLPRAVV